LNRRSVSCFSLSTDSTRGQLVLFRETFDGGGDNGWKEFGKSDVLGQVVERALLHHLHGDALVTVAGHDDEREASPLGGQGIEQFLSLHVRQKEVQEHDVGSVRVEPGDGVLPMVQGDDFKTVLPEASLGVDAEGPVIIDHQDDRVGAVEHMNESGHQSELSRLGTRTPARIGQVSQTIYRVSRI